MRLNTKKIVISGMLTALAVALSGFSIPVGVARCFPIQHLCNVIAAVFLGPVYGVGMAFSTSLIRNLMGTGSLLAFPGSMAGAFLSAWLYQHMKQLRWAYLGEVVGTGVIGALLSYPVATLVMGREAAVFTYVIPFLASTVCGTLMAVILIGALYRSGALLYLNKILAGQEK